FLARHLPDQLTRAGTRLVGPVAATVSHDRRIVVARNLARAMGRPLGGVETRRLVGETFAWYARYYLESFELPDLDAAAVDTGIEVDGFGPVERACASGVGPILVLPHLGTWEWAAWWLAQVHGLKVTAVVEPLDPPEVFDWFVGLRESLGMNIVPLGPSAAAEVATAVKRGDVVCLLSDRDLAGGGVPVTFFGERTRLPAGPAFLALRTGAPLMPTAVYWRGGSRHGLVLPAIDTERRGRFRDDVARVVQDYAHALEQLIRAAPTQWHMMAPNWPSDHRALGRRVPESLRDLEVDTRH
ncbi:MAG: phosphatidylinositol mannoside acyltransferase, partial [Acidimicrobiales bacterium]